MTLIRTASAGIFFGVLMSVLLFTGPGGWIRKTMNSLDGQITEPFPRQRFWLVIQGYDVSADETLAARRAAAELNPRMVLVARSRIDQSWEPRIVQVKAVP